MRDLAIEARGLGKRYTLGATTGQYATLRDRVASLARRPFRRGSRAPETDFWAIRDIDLDVKEGDVVGVIGRNGAGKSTLLKVLSRITEPTTGQAIVRGRVGSLLEVGTGFHPELTGRENIYLNGAILGMRRAEIDRKFDEIVAFGETGKFLDTPVKHYSSGMYVRLAFSVAAHLEPDILIVDEVLAVGDLAFQTKCLGKMQDVSSSGRTVLFVSHNMPAVARLCTKGVLLDGGRVAATGSAHDVVEQYLRGVRDTGTGSHWDDVTLAPGNDSVRLLGVDVLEPESGRPAAVCDVTRPLLVRVRHWCANPRLRYRVAVNFHTQGTCAFAALEPTETEKEKPGVYESSVIIPAHLLAEGEYSVNVTIFSSRGAKLRHVQQMGAAVFQTFDPLDGSSARGDYAEGLNGVLRPKLTWSEKYVASEPSVLDTARGGLS